jgi:crotonobetaine/carnitine-CoA ligase
VTVIADRARWTLPATLERAAEEFGDRRFLSFALGDRSLTYAEAQRQSAAVAAGLAGLGVSRGDRVLIMLPNRAEFVLTWFAANLLGAVQVPVNLEYRGDFLTHVIATADARVAVVDDEGLAAFAAVGDRLPELPQLVVVDEEPQGGRPFAELASGGLAATVDVRPAELAAVHFTSGTTGRSKGAMMTAAHQHLLGEQNRQLVDLEADDVYLSTLPLFHANAQLAAIYAAMLVGASVHLEPRFSASRFIATARATNATVTTTLGVMMPFVLNQPPRADDAENDLRCVWAVPCPMATATEFGARFGVERFAMPYGNTEVGLITDPRDRPPPGSCGRPDERFFEVRLVDPETDEPVPVGAAGEVVVRPRVPWIVTSGYFGMPERTLDAYRNLWFHTGDSLRQDADGWLWFVDRINDRIRRRGENIASADVEASLLQHPLVDEAAVVAVPSDVPGGEDELKACLVLADDAGLADVIAFAADRLPGFAVPRYFELFEELPKTPTAKVRKEALRSAGVTAATVERAS